MICEKMNIDIHEVIKAAQTKPFGFTPYYLVLRSLHLLDPNYLTWKAKQFPE